MRLTDGVLELRFRTTGGVKSELICNEICLFDEVNN